jgi:cytosine/adenosine deaminase-related metal-dependent hydrolase
MRTRLTADWVVGHDGKGHRLIEQGEVVFSGAEIEFVGRGFVGHVDRQLDYGCALISPGLIDLDALGDVDTGILTVDNGDVRAMGRLWSTDYLRRGPVDAYNAEQEALRYRYAFAQLIRNGITTALPIASMYYRRWAETVEEYESAAAIAAELGLRVYLGPCYMSGITVLHPDGKRAPHWDEARGLAGLEAVLRFAREHDGAHGGLVRAMLAPDRIETCTPELLIRTAHASREARLPIRLHACQSPYEFESVLALRGRTPLGWLEDTGVLGERLILPHALYLSGHPRVSRAGDEDWQRLVRSGATVAHCPVVFARMGEALNSFQRYQAAGINLGLGTDTWPPDLLHNMQIGLLLARVVGEDAHRPSIADLFNAATLGGARALGRDDLGRLSAGAQADIAVFDLRAPHLGPLFEPLKNLVLAGRGTDCRDSFIMGRQVMKDGVLPGVDLPALHRQAQDLMAVQLQHHRQRAFDHARMDSPIKPVFPLR